MLGRAMALSDYDGDAWGLCFFAGGGGGGRCVLGWRAPPSPWIKGPIQPRYGGQRLRFVCVDGWQGSNLPWPWPGALVRIKRAPKSLQSWAAG